MQNSRRWTFQIDQEPVPFPTFMVEERENVVAEKEVAEVKEVKKKKKKRSGKNSKAEKLGHLVKGVYVIAYTSKKRTSWIGPYVVEKVNPKGTVQLKIEGQNYGFTTNGKKIGGCEQRGLGRGGHPTSKRPTSWWAIKVYSLLVLLR